MYLLIEMRANRRDPQGYGEFVKIHGVYGSLHPQEFTEVYEDVCKLLGVDCLKMIHTMGVTGASNVGMAYEEVRMEDEVQLFAEFRDSKRFWIFELPPEGAQCSVC